MNREKILEDFLGKIFNCLSNIFDLDKEDRQISKLK